ncbi:pilus assembly protein [Nocardioides sp. zg-536]|uniref:Pilus assembly protein n=1 Tax=Nocardioides faecalis TaxID=2803858 RepID=A0A938Y9N7_9ACTN|nr:TadE family protein [Nocardioides faecalis]MBM9460410.1 pilus assembly protein [Nocardioides faecalis]QVI59765.1 pilus assembly protein [Nocardioides faecalis]
MEFALIVPVLLILVFGIIDFGFMLNDRQAVSQAAAEGARAAAVAVGGDEEREAAAASAARDALCRSDADTCAVAVEASVDPCTNDGTADCATVTVNLPFEEKIPLPIPGGGKFVFPRTLSYTAVARVS